VARARRRWIREQGLLDTTHLVFIDETSVNTNMTRLFGRAPRGERVIGRVTFSAWKTVTFVAALRHDGMTAPMMIKGAMIRRGLSGLCRLMPGADAQTRRQLRTRRSAICRRTLRTSIRSSCPTAPSRHCCASAPSVPRQHFAAASDSSCGGCPPKPAPTSSLTQDMLQDDRNLL
jgi:hypothetical protein